jgi:hypothetical protein
MDAEKAIAQISAAGIELTDRRRNDSDDAWVLRFANGAILSVHDSGEVTTEGHGIDAIAQIVDLPVGSRGT